MSNGADHLARSIEQVLEIEKTLPPHVRELMSHWRKLAMLTSSHIKTLERQAGLDPEQPVDRYEHFTPFLVVDNDRNTTPKSGEVPLS